MIELCLLCLRESINPALDEGKFFTFAKWMEALRSRSVMKTKGDVHGEARDETLFYSSRNFTQVALFSV